MKEILAIKEKLGNQPLPERIMRAIKDERCKISASSITAERVINLYGLRKESHSHDPAYKEVNLEIEKFLEYLKNSSDNLVLMINIISPETYAIVFMKEQADQVIGALDLTGLGKTGDYMETLFS